MPICCRLASDPEIRYTPSGVPVANFRLAVNEFWTGQNGEKQERAYWFSFVAWNNLAKTKVLILDDLGLAPMNAQERRDLLEVVEERHGSASTVVTAQLPVENWHENVRDPTIADAILDRLVHNAYKINLQGESMRKLRSSLTNHKNSGN